MDKMSKDYFIKQLVALLISSSLVACAAPGDGYESAGDPVTTSGRDCISQSTIRDYQVLDDRNLVVEAAGKRKYHVQLSRRAFGLKSNWKIGFKSPAGRVCSGSSDVIVEGGFERGEAIRISSIRELDPNALNDLLIQFGKKEPEIEQAPAEEEVKGAEVEELD
jgi:hypothetical protein